MYRLNLVLTVGVIRRLREHTEQLSRVALSSPDPILHVGDRVGDFAVTTTDGEQLSDDRFTGRTLVGFFSPGCPAPAQPPTTYSNITLPGS